MTNHLSKTVNVYYSSEDNLISEYSVRPEKGPENSILQYLLGRILHEQERRRHYTARPLAVSLPVPMAIMRWRIRRWARINSSRRWKLPVKQKLRSLWNRILTPIPQLSLTSNAVYRACSIRRWQQPIFSLPLRPFNWSYRNLRLFHKLDVARFRSGWNNKKNNPKHHRVLPKISDVRMQGIIEDLMSQQPGNVKKDRLMEAIWGCLLQFF